MSEHQELILELPKELVESSSGIGIDIGGSAIKVTYRHKEDWEEYCKQKQVVSKVKVRLRIYARDRLEEALHYLRNNCHITRNGDQLPLVIVTGVGGYQYDNLMAKVLNIKTQLIWEGKCMNNAFVYLSNQLTQEEFEYMPSCEEKTELQDVMIGMQRLEIGFCKLHGASQMLAMAETLDINSAIDDDVDRNLPIAKAVIDMYPCLLFFLNSAAFYYVVNGPRDFSRITAINNGGKTFLGLGSLLCGTTKTYDELIDMAEKGDYKNVDQTISSVLSVKQDDSSQNASYSSLAEGEESLDDIVYGFGKAATVAPDQFRKEDVIRCLLNMTARDHVSVMLPVILATGIRHVFSVGSFFQRPLVRTVIQKEFVRQKVTIAVRNNGKGLNAQLHFVKAAPYLCSIGAFMA